VEDDRCAGHYRLAKQQTKTVLKERFAYQFVRKFGVSAFNVRDQLLGVGVKFMV
jgi:hypothetical protein